MADLHVHQFDVVTGGTDPSSSPGNDYCFAWAKFSSQATRYVNADHSRTIAWGAGELYAGRKLWILWEWHPVAGRFPVRMLNLHTTPYYGGWSPDNSNGVSSLALDWRGDNIRADGSQGLIMRCQAEGARLGFGSNLYNWTLATIAECDALISSGDWLSIVLEIDIGVYPNGRVKGWAYGESTPRFDTGPITTQWPSATGWSLWEGIYNDLGVSTTHQHQFVPARVGPSLAAALQDGVDWAITESKLIGSVLKSNTSVAAYTHTTIGTRSTALFDMPVSLGGSGGGDPADHPAAPTASYWFGSQATTTVTAGSSGADAIRGCAYQANVTMDITTVYALMSGDLNVPASDVATVRATVYTMTGDPGSSGVPNALLGESAEVSVAGSASESWQTFSFTNAIRVERGTWYLLAIHTGGAEASTVFWDATGGYFFYKNSDAYAGGAAASWGTSTTTETRNLALFAAGPPARKQTGERLVGGTRSAGGGGGSI